MITRFLRWHEDCIASSAWAAVRRKLRRSVPKEFRMKKNLSAMLQKCTSLVLVSALGPLTGCLYAGQPGRIQSDESALASMEGVRVELIRHSTGCGSGESEGLIVEVGPGCEYPADAVRSLKSNCSAAPHPGVEVHVDGSTVMFDFSNVAEPGRFPDGEFEGYILDIVRTADAPFLIDALVDGQMTTPDVVQGDLSVDLDRLAVNLAGLTFDSNSFLKVDLSLITIGADADSSDEP